MRKNAKVIQGVMIHFFIFVHSEAISSQPILRGGLYQYEQRRTSQCSSNQGEITKRAIEAAL
jgi:hypothetical protein